MKAENGHRWSITIRSGCLTPHLLPPTEDPLLRHLLELLGDHYDHLRVQRRVVLFPETLQVVKFQVRVVLFPETLQMVKFQVRWCVK
jgi:hypothetical protein